MSAWAIFETPASDSRPISDKSGGRVLINLDNVREIAEAEQGSVVRYTNGFERRIADDIEDVREGIWEMLIAAGSKAVEPTEEKESSKE